MVVIIDLKNNLKNADYFKRHVPTQICEDITIEGMNFFKADAAEMIKYMTDLAKKNITIYKRIHYKFKYIL